MPSLEDAYLVAIKTGGLPALPELALQSTTVSQHLTPVQSEVPHDFALRLAFARYKTVFLGDLSYHARRPLFAIWAGILAFTAWGLSSGTVRIVSGDASVGGTKAHITSEFAVAMQLAIFTTLFYAFFISVAAGMTIVQDEEWRLGELLHATPLRTREYIWAKFGAVLAGCSSSWEFTWRRRPFLPRCARMPTRKNSVGLSTL